MIIMGNINDVIKVVLQKLAKKVDGLPSQELKSRLMQEVLMLEQLQIAEATLESENNAFGIF